MLPGMATNADGSLTIYIQKDSPGKDKETNWLPAPDGPIYMVMRLYWPKTENPSILPPGKGAWPPPAVVKASGCDPCDRHSAGSVVPAANQIRTSSCGLCGVLVY